MIMLYDKNMNLIFAHDYDGTQESIITTKNIYKRRILRFKNMLTENNKILFIFYGKCDHQDYIKNSHRIISLEDKAECKKFFFYLLEL